MELPRLSASNVPKKLPTPSSPRGSYSHLSFSADPKKSLISTKLKRLDLLPLGDLVDELLSTIRFGNDDARTAAIAQYEQREADILKALETDTHIALIESVEERFQGFALQHCTDLIKEYVCTTPSEKMLCEMAAGAMARHLSSARRLKDWRDEHWTQSNHRTRRPTRKYTDEYTETWTTIRDHLGRINTESKEVDRSLRQYQSIIAHLKQMRSPVPEVRINAFLANNQQVNIKTP